MVGNFLEVAGRDGLLNSAHFPSAIAVHLGPAIEDERDECALHFRRQLVQAGKGVFGFLTVKRQSPLLEDLLGIGALDFDVAKFSCPLTRLFAGKADHVFEPVDLIAA